MRTGLSLKLTEVRQGFTPAAGSLFHNKYSVGGYSTSGVVETFAAKHTFTRASVADWFSSDGVTLNGQTAINVPRIDGRGVLIEPSFTADALTADLTGGADGSPGTPPTGMSVPTIAGLTRTITDMGVIGGYRRIRIGYTGSTSVFSAQVIALPGSIVSSIGDTVFIGTSIGLATGGFTAGTSQFTLRVAAEAGGMNFTPAAFARVGNIRVLAATNRNISLRWNFVDIGGSTSGPVDWAIDIGLPVMGLAPVGSGAAWTTSPVIATTGSAATRAAEALTAVVTTGADYCIAGVGRLPVTAIPGAHFFNLGTDANNVFRIRRANGDPSVLVAESVVGGVGQGSASTLTAALVNGQRFGWCARRAGANVSVSVNGAAVVTAAPASLPGAAVVSYVGQQSTGSGAWGDFIEEIAGFGSGKSDGQMQAYSTLGGIV